MSAALEGEAKGTAALILAAGFSRRLGRPKQTQIVGGVMLVEHAVSTALAAELSPVIVVVNPECTFAPALQQRGCRIVTNHEAAEGMASSIRCGVTSAMQLHAAGLVVMTCDQIALRPQHLQALCSHPGQITGSLYAGRTGIPAYFPATAFPDLLRLQGDTGARDLLRTAASVPAAELELDVDSEADLQRAVSWIQNAPLR